MRIPHLITAMLLSAAAWAQLPFSFSGSAGGDCAPQIHSEPWPGTTAPNNAVRFDWSATNTTGDPIPMQVFVYRNTYALGGGGFVTEQILHAFTITAAPNTTTTGADFWPCASTQFEVNRGHSVRVAGPNGTCTAFSMTVSLGTPAFANDAEGNNSFGTGALITTAADNDGHLRFNGATDDDWYRIQLPAQGKMVMTLQSETPGATASTMLADLYYTSGTYINGWSGSTGTNNVPNTNMFEQTCRGGSTITYYLRLRALGDCDVSYRLTVSVVAPVFGIDPTADNTLVAYNTYQDGQQQFDSPSDNSDIFAIAPPFNGVMSIEVQAEHAGPVQSTMQVRLLYSSGSVVQTWNVPSGANGVPITTVVSIPCRGTSPFQRISFQSATCGASYRFKYTVAQPLFTNDAEPNNSTSQAVILPEGQTAQGQVNFADDDNTDSYRVNLSSDGVMNVIIEAEHAEVSTTGIITVELYMSAGTILQTWTAPIGANSTPISTALSKTCRGNSGTYYVRVSSSTCGTSYRISYSVTPPFFAQDAEPNSGTGQAIVLPETQTAQGHLNFYFGDNSDDYRANLSDDGVMNVTIEAEHADVSTAGIITVELYMSAGTILETWTAPVGANSTPISTALSKTCRGNSGTYYMRVSSSICGTSYRISYAVTPPFFAQDAEPNNSTSQAIVLPEGQTAQGHLNFYFGDNDDVYRANLSGDGVMNVNIEAEHADASATGIITVQLSVSSGTILQTWTAPVGANSLAISTALSKTCRGNAPNYYLTVSSDVCGTSYRISYSVTPPFYANDPEPNNSTPGTPMDLNAANQQGHIGFYNTTDDDYYAFTHPGGPWSITVSAEHAEAGEGTMGLVVINNPGTVFGTFTVPVGGSSTALTNTFTIPSLPAGTIYRVRLSDITCGVSYRIHCYDTDNDGTCNAFDLCAGGPEPGTPCNDNSACTTGDVIQANCTCAGTAVDPNDNDPCTLDSCDPITGVSNVFQDADADGTCDANDLCPGGPEPGTACNDNDACTTGDVIGTNCLCAGTFADADADGTCDANDLCPGGPEPGTACNDNNACTTGDVIGTNCLCAGTFADADADGTCDANDLCPGGPEPGTVCNDNNGATINDIIQANCLCAGTLLGNDCEGVPGGPAVPGTACNDNNACTTGDIYDTNCLCAGTFQDADADGTCDANDLCPGGPEPGTACNDNNACTTGDVIGTNCLCAGTFADADADGTCDANDLCPGGPEPGTACNDNNANTDNDVIGANCLCAGTPIGGCTPNMEIAFQLDGLSTVSWELRAQGTNAVVQNGTAFLPIAGDLTQTACLPDGCYYLVVADDSGDGITGGGYILSTITPERRVIDNRNNFLDGYTSQVASNEGFCLPFGNDRLISASCDRLQLQRGPSANCSDKLTADNTPNGTSGNVYQFQVFDPNGDEVPVLVPATGAGSNTLAMNQLPTLTAGKLYNVRVRTRISPGVYRAWGPACRMSIAVPPACPTTQLVTDMSSSNWSCGKTVTLPTGGNGGANRITAVPVTRFNANCVSVAANKYQFRFRDVDNNTITVVNGVGSNSFCYMTASAFQPCRAYEVDVRASFNNGGVWCDYGTACDVFTSGCSVGSLNAVADQGTALQMYPNPNRGDQLMLVLEHIEANANTVSVDIYDSFGKRVSARTIAVADGFINTVIELNGELAAGLYVVNITAGEQVFTERLVIQP